jgi:glycosyltransferase involved in cell wall biosynthesis
MPFDLIIDMRCLQDPNYARHGVGNHARAMISRAPRRFTGIIDPRLPALDPEIAALAAELSPHGYVTGLSAGAVFLNPFPMYPNQLFIARLLGDPAITKAAIVYDFIPLDEPARYLADAAVRLDYFNALAWLRRYDLFFPISEPTDARLRGLFGNIESLVTGAALPAWMEQAVPAAPRHVLLAGGDDARKNPEILLQARAASAALRDVPVIVTGGYSADAQARLAAIAPVKFPGHVPDAAMRRLYEEAYCVVAPSRAEGFSLPVIEAMAARTPAVVSDIPAHRALVPDAATRFAPDDVSGLAAILQGIVGDPAWRARLVAAQADGGRRVTGAAVATKLWDRLRPLRFAIGGGKPRVALLTPLPPAKSGVADHSAALAHALEGMTDLTLIGADEVSAQTYLSRRFDRVVSVVGNNAKLHGRIHDLAVEYGSAVICHDARLLHMAAARGLPHAALRAAAELGRPVGAEEVGDWMRDETRREANFLGPLAASARPLIMHSAPMVRQVNTRFAAQAQFVPFAIYRPFPAVIGAAERANARQHLGLEGDTPLIASFGFINRSKGVETVLDAFAALRQTHAARLVFAGDAPEGLAAFADMAAARGLSASVAFTRTFLSEADYRAWLLAADAGVQWREAGYGNTSGALQDCIAAGLPTAAPRDLADNLNAPAYIRRIDTAAGIAPALAALLDSRQDTEAARTNYCAAHSMVRYARDVMHTLGFDQSPDRVSSGGVRAWEWA